MENTNPDPESDWGVWEVVGIVGCMGEWDIVVWGGFSVGAFIAVTQGLGTTLKLAKPRIPSILDTRLRTNGSCRK